MLNKCIAKPTGEQLKEKYQMLNGEYVEIQTESLMSAELIYFHFVLLLLFFICKQHYFIQPIPMQAALRGLIFFPKNVFYFYTSVYAGMGYAHMSASLLKPGRMPWVNLKELEFR